jgi:hypothetical protein
LSAVAYTLSTLISPYAWVVTPGQQGQMGVGTAAASIGGNINADVRARIIIPPSKLLGLSVFSGAGTTPLFLFGVNWHEIEADLE